MTLQNSINANASTPLSSTQGGLGVSAPTAHGILVGEGASAVNPIVLTAGQLLIGTTAGDPAAASITSTGGSIVVTSGSGTINLETAAAGESWTDVTLTTQTMVPNHGYTASNVATVVFTLPTTAAYGSIIEVSTGTTAGGWSIAQATGQTVRHGNLVTTSGATGSLASTGQGDTVRILCTVANTTFQVLSSQGEINVT